LQRIKTEVFYYNNYIMKKYQKYLIFFLVLIPVVMLPVIFVTCNMNVPFFIVLSLLITLLAGVFIVIFLQREMKNTSLQKRRKRVLITFCGLITILLIATIIAYKYDLTPFWKNYGLFFQFLVTIGIFLWAYFRKEPKQVEKDKKE